MSGMQQAHAPQMGVCEATAARLERIAFLNCPACGKLFIRAVGTPEDIASPASSLQERHQHDHAHGGHCHEHYEAGILGR